MANSSAIVNFGDPFAYQSTEVAYQTAVSGYIQVAALGAHVWDMADNLPFDLKLLFLQRPTLSSFAYFGSRIGTLGYVLIAALYGGAPTGHCGALETVNDSFYPVSIGFSGLLFLIRLRAIYNDNRVVVGSFFILWCGLVVSAVFIPVGLVGGNVGPTNYCTDIEVPISAYASVIAPLVNDTLVFIAISWRLTKVAHLDGSLKDSMKVAVFGKYLPIFTKSLLIDGQRYYLISLVSNVVTVVMGSDTSIPAALRSMWVSPNVALVSIMACRVYRRTKTGALRETEISTTAFRTNQTKLAFAPPPTTTGTQPNLRSSYHVDIDISQRLSSHPSDDGAQPELKSLGDVEKGLP